MREAWLASAWLPERQRVSARPQAGSRLRLRIRRSGVTFIAIIVLGHAV